ncbi:MAG: Metallophosphoesterase [Bacteroidetes bacterium]|nr:Metallophosphoesterase [Bacteroidota bacterium]
MRTLMLALLAAFLSIPLAAQVDTVTIFHVNDSHSNLSTLGSRDALLDGSLGGIARVATAVGMTRMEDPEALVLHAGDISIGDLFYTQYFAVAELRFLLALGFDAMTLGNHEFDLGPGYLKEMLDTAFVDGSLPLLSANAVLEDPLAQDLKAYVRPYTVKQVGGTSVGIFGLTTPTTNLISNPAPVFIDTNFIATAARMVDTLKAKGCQVVICLSHLGYLYDQYVASSVPGIDAIVGGHDHFTFVTPNAFLDPLGDTTWIVQASSYYLNAGKLRLVVEGGQARLLDFSLIPIDSSIPKEPTADASVQALIAGIESTYGPLFSTPVGVVADYCEEVVLELKTLGSKDTPIGNLVADTWRAFLQTDVGVQAGGSTAHPLYAGPITGADVFRVCGYGFNTDNGLGFHLAKFSMSGMALQMGLEFGVSDLESTDDFLLQVSGMTYKYDPTAPPYSRVHSVFVGGAPLELFRMYTVGANEFTAMVLETMGLPYEDLHVYSGDTTEFQVLLAAISTAAVVQPYTDERVMAELPTDVAPALAGPVSFALEQNYPNPFNPNTTIRYALPEKADVVLTVFNTLGQRVVVLSQGERGAGVHEVVFDASALPSGVYFYRLTAGNIAAVRKCVVAK